jgi:hypothetical protein
MMRMSDEITEVFPSKELNRHPRVRVGGRHSRATPRSSATVLLIHCALEVGQMPFSSFPISQPSRFSHAWLREVEVDRVD